MIKDIIETWKANKDYAAKLNEEYGNNKFEFVNHKICSKYENCKIFPFSDNASYYELKIWEGKTISIRFCTTTKLNKLENSFASPIGFNSLSSQKWKAIKNEVHSNFQEIGKLIERKGLGKKWGYWPISEGILNLIMTIKYQNDIICIANEIKEFVNATYIPFCRELGIPVKSNLQTENSTTNDESVKEELKTAQISSDSFGSSFYDEDNAKEIGFKGEELVNKYLNKQKELGNIEKYEWLNKDGESGKPYDFTIEEKSGNVVYIDVKSTTNDFNRAMHFSVNEIEFVSNGLGEKTYHIYRVCGIKEEKQYFKKCRYFKDYAKSLNKKISDFRTDLQKIYAADFQKITIQTENESFSFDEEEIAL
jgi:hypothetical protein